MLTFGNGGMKNSSNPVHLTRPKSQHWSSFDNIYIWTADTVFRPHSRHTSKYTVLGNTSLFPGTRRIASSSTACYIVALFSCYSNQLPTVFTLICFCLHSATSHHQHGTYGQPGEESLFTEESRSTPWASTCTCIAEDSQFSLPIQCLNSNLPV